MSKCALEVLIELHLDRLFLIVLEALLSLAVEALLTIEQVRSLVPNVAEGVDVEGLLLIASLHHDGAAVLNGITNLSKANTSIFHKLLELSLVLVTHLDDYTRILSEECLHDITFLADVVQVDVHTALRVGEAHLEQSGNQTTSRDIVTSHNPTLFDELLDSHEGISEILGVLNCRHIIANLTQTLSEGRTTEALLVEREVDMIE